MPGTPLRDDPKPNPKQPPVSNFISTLASLPPINTEVLIKTERGLITNAIYLNDITRPGQPYPVFWRCNDGYGFTVSALAYAWCDIPKDGK
jgi:hypothetical protein